MLVFPPIIKIANDYFYLTQLLIWPLSNWAFYRKLDILESRNYVDLSILGRDRGSGLGVPLVGLYIRDIRNSELTIVYVHLFRVVHWIGLSNCMHFVSPGRCLQGTLSLTMDRGELQ